ncbi:ER degradation-enhancing alpha-mannosidase-like protein 2 [Neodiprion lecontei]|uniref:alpha-1,2-Mannosidase n=1 Tax=Neodiprion lecontei TaxID=441921 RepID=A0A6J0C082_NEOLC|nr:ER degradation-enhancing alpha-mannosidase-like protein 2 [Neodiprion lecontei]XP_046595179.1 ER degradation-enhancing alpha-mannosidase-like protein 2 [Neodiprion lecontei]
MHRIASQLLIIPLFIIGTGQAVRNYARADLLTLREEVRTMFNHAYSSYLTYAYPYDELRSLSCDGFDTWGSYSLTLIDALDTLVVMGNYTEFKRVVDILSSRSDFEENINVSVFETNIRVVGGLLSAHLLSHKAGLDLDDEWPCKGPLLRLAEDVAKRIIPAFDTPTGMPYGTVNLKHGVPDGETSITCTAGIGTFILEFGTLSRLTGNPLYEEVALNAMKALHHYRSKIGLLGNHIDVLTGHWTAQDSGIGAGIDSYFEYLAKGALLLQDPLLVAMFNDHKAAIEKYMKKEDWHLWVSMSKGQVTLPVFQSLEAYWPGVLSFFGDISSAMKSLHNYHQVWKQFGFTPEFYNIPQADAGANREGYPLRPELIESVMYLYRATKDPYLIEVGVDILRSLQHSAKTSCGYATINDVRDHRKADRMESFFLAETTKYLYLLFDPDNFIHNDGQRGTVIKTKSGQCVIDAGGYVFNTEAHPIDPGSLHCCKKIEGIFPSKKSMLKKFVVANNEGRIEPEKGSGDAENDPVEVIKLSQIKLDPEEPPSIKTEEIEAEEADNEALPEAKNYSQNISRSELPKIEVVAPPNTIYRADDSDAIDIFEAPAGVNGEYPSMAEEENNTQTSYDKPKFSKRNKVEPDEMLENIRNSNMYPINDSMRFDYQLLSCQSQPFLQRISIIGEFF